MTDERPDGALSGLLWDYSQRVAAVNRHAAAEGVDVGPRTVLESYDRTLHPIMHGRRFEDLARWFRARVTALQEVFERDG